MSLVERAKLITAICELLDGLSLAERTEVLNCIEALTPFRQKRKIAPNMGKATRAEIVKRVLAGEKAADVAAKMQVHVSRVYNAIAYARRVGELPKFAAQYSEVPQ